MGKRVGFFVCLMVLIVVALPGAEAGGTIHLRYGWSEQADTWWEENGILFYEYKGERHGIPMKDVLKIEGHPDPRRGRDLKEKDVAVKCDSPDVTRGDIERLEEAIDLFVRLNMPETAKRLRTCLVQMRKVYREVAPR